MKLSPQNYQEDTDRVCIDYYPVGSGFWAEENHCEQTNDLLSSMREDHVMGSH
jgi:hypothetical protein